MRGGDIEPLARRLIEVAPADLLIGGVEPLPDLLRKLSREAQVEQRQLWDQRTEQSMKKIREAGISVISLTPAEKQRFQASVKPVWDKYGGKYAELVKRIQAVSS